MILCRIKYKYVTEKYLPGKNKTVKMMKNILNITKDIFVKILSRDFMNNLRIKNSYHEKSMSKCRMTISGLICYEQNKTKKK